MKGDIMFIAPPTLKWEESPAIELGQLVAELGARMRLNVREMEVVPAAGSDESSKEA